GDITATCSTTRLSDIPPHPDLPQGDTGTIGDPPDEAIDEADGLETNVITGLRVSKKYLEDDIDSDDINWPISNKVPTLKTTSVAPEPILSNNKIWERSNCRPSSSASPLSLCDTDDSDDPNPTKIEDDHDYDDSSGDQLFNGHGLHLVSSKDVTHPE
ncbi:hypothetical protein FOZ62_022645, partial [Perkinsus olseni]